MDDTEDKRSTWEKVHDLFSGNWGTQPSVTNNAPVGNTAPIVPRGRMPRPPNPAPGQKMAPTGRGVPSPRPGPPPMTSRPLAKPSSYRYGGTVKKSGMAMVHKGEKITPTGTLDAADRKRIPASQFGMRGQRKYPMPDKSHARVALGRATQMEKRGKLSASSAAKIRAKARAKLGKA